MTNLTAAEFAVLTAIVDAPNSMVAEITDVPGATPAVLAALQEAGYVSSEWGGGARIATTEGCEKVWYA